MWILLEVNFQEETVAIISNTVHDLTSFWNEMSTPIQRTGFSCEVDVAFQTELRAWDVRFWNISEKRKISPGWSWAKSLSVLLPITLEKYGMLQKLSGKNFGMNEFNISLLEKFKFVLKSLSLCNNKWELTSGCCSFWSFSYFELPPRTSSFCVLCPYSKMVQD